MSSLLLGRGLRRTPQGMPGSQGCSWWRRSGSRQAAKILLQLQHETRAERGCFSPDLLPSLSLEESHQHCLRERRHFSI